jgi:CHAT domain-containing protein
MARGLAAFLLLVRSLLLPAFAETPCLLNSTSKEKAREAAILLAASRYEEAERVSVCAEAKARGEGDRRLLAKILNNLGAARLYQKNFQGAYGPLREASELARQHGTAESEAGIWSNLATLYGMLGAWPAAAESLERALKLMPANSRFRPAVLAQRVRLAARRPDLSPEEFSRLWGEAMEGAENQHDWMVQRHLWDELFNHHLERGRLAAAEDALANSFRIVTLQRLPDAESLWMLAGQLRLAQGRPAEALVWLKRIQERGSSRQNPVSSLRLAAAEARAEAALHGPEAALASCRRSWPGVMEWRHAVLPDPSVELAADVAMTELVNEYVEAALASGNGRGREEEAWAAVEQSRALGMLRRKRRQRAEGSDPDSAGLDATSRIVSRAAGGNNGELPLRTASFVPPSSFSGAAPAADARQLLRWAQARLHPRQALFTFWLGPRYSVMWVVTNDSISSARLPGREELVRGFRRFREEIERGSDLGDLAARLYSLTFGRAHASLAQRSEWLISADDEPLSAPLAALRDSGEPPRLLGESVSLSLLPSALWLLEAGGYQPPQKLLAVGGLIHNSADPRWRSPESSLRPASAGVSGRNPARGRAPSPELELPTLPGSAREVESVAALWKNHGLTASRLSGFDATADAVHAAMQQNWSDLHFATHVQPAPAPLAYKLQLEPGSALPVLVRFPAGEPFLALTLRPDGVRDGLTGREVARFRLDGTRVVLNGCSTGGGPAQRGAGISSFAHAWLAAGARSVIASLWPVDDDGAFFEAYYTALLQGSRPAAALQAAQNAMIRSRTWRSQPRYWAAYIHLGKD